MSAAPAAKKQRPNDLPQTASRRYLDSHGKVLETQVPPTINIYTVEKCYARFQNPFDAKRGKALAAIQKALTNDPSAKFIGLRCNNDRGFVSNRSWGNFNPSSGSDTSIFGAYSGLWDPVKDTNDALRILDSADVKAAIDSSRITTRKFDQSVESVNGTCHDYNNEAKLNTALWLNGNTGLSYAGIRKDDSNLYIPQTGLGGTQTLCTFILPTGVAKLTRIDPSREVRHDMSNFGNARVDGFGLKGEITEADIVTVKAWVLSYVLSGKPSDSINPTAEQQWTEWEKTARGVALSETVYFAAEGARPAFLLKL